jgi:CDP-diacylglycerol--glycerol-3-phosphate 3-phosphatidyltransferase/molybdopterin converting factor subunit 1
MLTLPNLLTLSRIVAVPLLVAFLWWPRWEAGFGIAFALYCLMGITDYFDGYLARAQGAVSKLGVFLDPIADKIMVAAVILMLVGTRHDDDRALIANVHLIAALIILLREIAVSGLREFLAGLQVSLPVSKLAATRRLRRAHSRWRTAGTGLDQGHRPWLPVGGGGTDAGDGLGLPARRHPAHGLTRMAIEILYFAWVRERMGRAQETIDPAPDVTTVAALVDWLAARDDVSGEALADRARLRAAVDQAFVPMDASIVGAKEIALFPPVTGG